jgi:hypothetical protein
VKILIKKKELPEDSIRPEINKDTDLSEHNNEALKQQVSAAILNQVPNELYHFTLRNSLNQIPQ